MAIYLVTGGAGFIGAHLVEHLLAAGHAVRVVDDLSSGSHRQLDARAEFLHGDVADQALMQRAMQGVAGCYHLAAIPPGRAGGNHWVAAHRANLGGSVTILDAARHAASSAERRAGGVPVVYASAAAIYGDQAAKALHEGLDPAPLTAFGADKLGTELHARIAFAAHGVPSCGLRFFTVYGGRQPIRPNHGNVVAIFAGQLARGERLSIHGDGSQRRDFVHVADAVIFLRAAMARLQCHPEAATFNVCTGRPVSVLQLAHAMCQHAAVPPRLAFQPRKPVHLASKVGDPSWAEEMLRLRPLIRLEDGLAHGHAGWPEAA